MAKRFPLISDNELQEMIASLVRQLGSGIATLNINGIMTTYSSPANIRLAIAEFETELAERAFSAAKLPRRAVLVPQYPSLPGKGY